jgi:hypothetical protein
MQRESRQKKQILSEKMRMYPKIWWPFFFNFSFCMDVFSSQEFENLHDCSFPHLLPELLLIFSKIWSLLFGCKRFACVVRTSLLNSSVLHMATPRQKRPRQKRISTRSACLGVVYFWCVQSIVDGVSSLLSCLPHSCAALVCSACSST